MNNKYWLIIIGLICVVFIYLYTNKPEQTKVDDSKKELEATLKELEESRKKATLMIDSSYNVVLRLQNELNYERNKHRGEIARLQQLVTTADYVNYNDSLYQYLLMR